MSDQAVESVEETHDDHHPSDLDYVKVFLALVVLTAVEVATFFIEMPTEVLIGSLAVLMAAKFYLIAAWFMHLRIDAKLFSQLVKPVLGMILRR